jgi:hypothetical protein
MVQVIGDVVAGAVWLAGSKSDLAIRVSYRASGDPLADQLDRDFAAQDVRVGGPPH